eukprot:GEMP01018351.1.p1 GENE.GEMP01018351.1~~GEMP01018351.1.p1  ORF type:complete len:257 (+),score=61.54 GEMP01018351.1:228-998(+)
MGSSPSSVLYDPFSMHFSDHYVLCDQILGKGCYGEVKAGRLRPTSYASNYDLESPPSLDDGRIDQNEILTRVEARMRLGRTDHGTRSCFRGGSAAMAGVRAPFAVKLLRRKLLNKEASELDEVNRQIAQIEAVLKCSTSDDVAEKLLRQEQSLRKRRFKLQKASRKIVSRERVMEELLILSRCRTHSHIVDFIEAFESDDLVHMVFERAYGDVFARWSGKAPEVVCRKWATQLLDALEFLREMTVAHRDIKPKTEN